MAVLEYYYVLPADGSKRYTYLLGKPFSSSPLTGMTNNVVTQHVCFSSVPEELAKEEVGEPPTHERTEQLDISRGIIKLGMLCIKLYTNCSGHPNFQISNL